MKTEQTNVQSFKANVYRINKYKHSYIYYAHSMCFYDTKTEKEDLKFLKSKQSKIINPNGLRLGKDIFQYLFKVKECGAVWYRGNTIGVVFEVITALSMKKPVYSLETKDIMNHYEITDFVNIFHHRPYIEQDLSSFEAIFPEYLDNFLRVLDGEMP